MLQEATLDHSGSILGSIQGSEVLRASAGPSRGALLPKSTFSASVSDFYSIGSLLGSLWALFGAPLVALGVPLGIPKGALLPS